MAFSDDLTTTYVPAHALRPGLRLKPLQSRGADLTEKEIDDMIARTLAEERQAEARAALPELASQEELSGTAGRETRRASRVRSAAEARLAQVGAQYAEVATDGSAPPVEDLRQPKAPLIGRLVRIPRVPRLPSWMRYAVPGLLLLTALWFQPGLVMLAAVFVLLLGAALVLALGSDAVSNALIRLYHWRRARNPDRAERMRQRLDGIAMRVDMVLDRLPAGWTTGLYMADFSREALSPVGDAAQGDPFDRLRAEVRHD